MILTQLLTALGEALYEANTTYYEDEGIYCRGKVDAFRAALGWLGWADEATKVEEFVYQGLWIGNWELSYNG